MRNFYSYLKSFAVIFGLLITTTATSQDFNIQHLQDDIGRTGGTNTGFTAVASLNNAVALANNNRKTQAGTPSSSSALEGDDLAGARVLTATGTLTYYRESASVNSNTRFNTSIWEYIGSSGGVNEMIVRGRYAVDLNGGTYTVDQSISGITDKDKCIPFITGIMNSSGTDDADSGTAIAYLTSSSNMRVEKGGTNSPNVRVYITLVEFTGTNWTVLHGDSGATAGDTGSITLYDGSDGTGTATDVSHWSDAIIFTHHRGDTAVSGTNDSHSDNWPTMIPGSDDQTVDWAFFNTHDSDGTNRHFVHVLVNEDIYVTRYSDTNVAVSGTIDITASGLSDLNQSLIVGSTYHSGTGAGYGRGWRNYKFNSLTQAEHWGHRAGGGTATIQHELQVVDFTTAGPALEGPGGVMTNMALWIKADKGVEEAAGDTAEDTDTVLNWLDYSGNDNDAVQSTGANRPVYNENVLNFNPSIDFDGTNHEMTATVAPNSTMTIFAVAEGTYNTTKHLLNLNGGGSGSVSLEQTAATTFQGRYYDGVGPSGVVTTTIANGTPFISGYEFVAGSNSQLFDDGVSQGTAATNAYTLPGTVTAGIGTHPTNSARRWDGGIAEMVVYTSSVTTTERDQIESYFAIKYGITLGVNGTSQDYLASDATVIWDQSANAGFNYNVTGIGQDDDSDLKQKQSKTINTTDDITIGIKEIASTNDANTNQFFSDITYLMWGNDNGATTATTDITKDFGSGTSTATSVSATPIVRKWKLVVKDSVPTVRLSIPESMVSATNPGGEEYIMIVADDAAFTTNVTSATMDDVGTELEVDFYFEGTKFITFGSAAETAEMSRAVSFDRSDMYLTAGNVNDLANSDYTISAWVKRNTGAGKFDIVSKRNYFNENTDLDPGPDNDGEYTHGYAFRINQDNKFRMVWRDPNDSSNNIMQTSASIPEGEWHHICAVYDSSEGALGTTRLYIDGILEDTDDTLDPMNVPSDAHFMIGAAHHIKRQQKLDGSVDEIRVWNTALSADQIRYIMNQEIEENTTLANGKILPLATTKNEINSIPWNNLIAYYPMNKIVFGSMVDYSDNGNDASMINYDHVDEQTAPLPYVSAQNGDWDTSTTWVNGDVQYLPGVDTYLDVVETIDYNIVQIDHDVDMENGNITLIPAANNDTRTLLGLIVNSGGKLQVDGNNESGTGNAVRVTHYLKLDGEIDLEGESQLIQTTDSDLDVTSAGTLEKDQQGTADTYTYNYWSSPVGVSNITSNNNSFSLADVLRDGTDAANLLMPTWLTGGYNGTSGSPIGIADYWIWKFANQTSDDYSSWQHIRSTGSILVGEGFTMKGPGSGGISDDQNYAFIGKPNNGDINLTNSAGNDYLIGNPYPSAIDAEQFILDNGNVIAGSGGTTGTLYFWEHWGGGSHYLSNYQGGYATYNLSGGAPSASMGSNHPDVATGGTPTKTPGRYIPVGQGFFVVAETAGTLNFNNAQRIFEKESVNSVFMEAPPQNDVTLGDGIDGGNPITLDTEDLRTKLRIGFNSVNTLRRQLLITIDPNTTEGFDYGYDAQLTENQLDDIYWLINDEKYQIQAQPDLTTATVLPLGFHAENDGLNSITIDERINFPADITVFLNDKSLDIQHNLVNSDYEFFSLAGQYQERFELIFKTPVTPDDDGDSDGNADDIILEDPEESGVFAVYYSNDLGSIVIVNPNEIEIKSIGMHNVIGQMIFRQDRVPADRYINYRLTNLSTGTYVIQLQTEEGQITKKVLVE